MIRPVVTAVTSATTARQIRKDNEKNNFYQEKPGFDPESSNPEDEYLESKKDKWLTAAKIGGISAILFACTLGALNQLAPETYFEKIETRGPLITMEEAATLSDIEIDLPQYDTIVDVKSFFGKTTIIIKPGEIPYYSENYVPTYESEPVKKIENLNLNIDIKYDYSDILSQDSVKGLTKEQIERKVKTMQYANSVLYPYLDLKIDGSRKIEDISR